MDRTNKKYRIKICMFLQAPSEIYLGRGLLILYLLLCLYIQYAGIFVQKKPLPDWQRLVKCSRTYKLRESGTASPHFRISSSRYDTDVCNSFSCATGSVYSSASASIRPRDTNFDNATSSALRKCFCDFRRIVLEVSFRI